MTFAGLLMSPGLDDANVLELAHAEDRILITNDKGFGARVFEKGDPHSGVILLRLTDERPPVAIRVLSGVLEQHSFPGTKVVTRRLLLEHGVAVDATPSSRKSPSDSGKCEMFCRVLARSGEWYEGHNFITSSKWTLWRSAQPFDAAQCLLDKHDGAHTLSSHGRVIDLELLGEGTVGFRITVTLPVETDYDSSETPFDFCRRTGRTPVSFSELPGTTAFDVGHHLSEYFGLREVEKWLKAHA
jgi:hypothetical protein